MYSHVIWKRNRAAVSSVRRGFLRWNARARARTRQKTSAGNRENKIRTKIKQSRGNGKGRKRGKKKINWKQKLMRKSRRRLKSDERKTARQGTRRTGGRRTYATDCVRHPVAVAHGKWPPVSTPIDSAATAAAASTTSERESPVFGPPITENNCLDKETIHGRLRSEWVTASGGSPFRRKG